MSTAPQPLQPPPGLIALPAIHAMQYSSIDVLELPLPATSIMKRRRDHYMNATQILKLAGLDKTKRTRVIERDIIHPGVSIHGVTAALGGSLPLSQSSSSTPAATSALHPQDINVYEKVQGGYGRYQGTWIPLERAARLCVEYGVYGILRNLIGADPDGVVMSKSGGILLVEEVLSMADALATGASLSPSANRVKIVHDPVLTAATTPSSSLLTRPDSSPFRSALPSSVNLGRVVASANAHPDAVAASDTALSLHQQSAISHRSQSLRDHRDLLQSIFLRDPSAPSSQSDLLAGPPPADLDPNIALDDDNNTALHYAAALAHIPALQWLLHSANASPHNVNTRGESALHRAVMYTSAYDRRVFAQIVLELGSVVGVCDSLGRTVLHHAVLATRIHGRAGVGRYYASVLLQYILEHKEAQQGMEDVVDVQDRDGNTALCLAANIGARGAMELLIAAGADSRLRNYAGVGVGDYVDIQGGGCLEEAMSEDDDMQASSGVRETAVGLNGTNESGPVSVIQAKTSQVKSVVDGMLREMDAEFTRDILQRNNDRAHAQQEYRQAAHELAAARRRLELSRAQAKELTLLRRRVAVLRDQVNGGQDISEVAQTSAWTDPASCGGIDSLRVYVAAAMLELSRQRSEIGSLVQTAKEAEIESKLRRIVAMCLKAREEQADELVAQLQRAAEEDGRGESSFTLEDIEGFLSRPSAECEAELPLNNSSKKCDFEGSGAAETDDLGEDVVKFVALDNSQERVEAM